MKAKNFRIGNVIKYDNRIFTIDTIAEEFPTLDTIEFGVGVVDWNNIELIELTEDWLQEMGFKMYAESVVCKGWGIGENPLTHDYLLTLTWMKNDDGTLAECFYKNGHYVIKYVHELQNLFFAITRQELELETLA